MEHPIESEMAKESGWKNPLADLPPLFPEEGTKREECEIKIGTTTAVADFAGKSSNVAVFTMTLGDETIALLPQRTWTQLDRYKWGPQGKLPGQPAGLEIGLEQVHFAGHTLCPSEPAGRATLERLLNDWLASERASTRQKAATPLGVTALEPSPQPDPTAMRFHVEVDKRGQVHVHCIQDKKTLATIGLTAAGFHSLVQQGFMRKPQVVQTGVLHDWVELDGELFSFAKGMNDAARLEQTLNERYRPSEVSGGNEVRVLVNTAAAHGFDIQFPAMIAGVQGSHRHHLDEGALELLQDKQHCHVLHEDIIIKLSAPNLVFKRRTPDGGEQYLAGHQDNLVIFTDEDGRQKTIDLSQPVSFLHLSAADLTAVFNHPSISRHSKSSLGRGASAVAPAGASAPTAAPENIATAPPPSPQASPIQRPPVSPPACPSKPAGSENQAARSGSKMEREEGREEKGTSNQPAEISRILPNAWLKEPLSNASVRHEWLAPLAYRKMARHFENSSEGTFGGSPCWFITLNGEQDIAARGFKGIFLTEKGGLGFLSQGQIARFNNGAAFLGKIETVHEALGVELVGLGLSGRSQVTFIVADDYRNKFELAGGTLIEMLKHLNKSGAIIMSIQEMLHDHERLEVLWTLPASQPDPDNPQVVELRPVG
jgi:hypothetical protein